MTAAPTEIQQGKPARRRKAWFVCGIAFIGLVIYLSLTSSPIDAGRLEGVKVGHFIAYAWLMVWFAEIYPSTRTRIAWGITFVLMGVALEYLQGLTIFHRTFAYSDMRDNAYGVLAGAVIAWTRVGDLFSRFNRG